MEFAGGAILFFYCNKLLIYAIINGLMTFNAIVVPNWFGSVFSFLRKSGAIFD